MPLFNMFALGAAPLPSPRTTGAPGQDPLPGRLLLLAPCAATLLLLGLLGAGCRSLPVEDTPGGVVVYDAGANGGPDGGIRQNRPVMTGEIAPIYGFVDKSARTEYYYLGEVDPDPTSGQVPVNAMYLFYDQDGTPLFRLSADGSQLVGWHPIVDVVPTQGTYSPFWRVVKVTVKGQVDDVAMANLACPDGRTTCNGTCASLKNNAKHCGKCDYACKTGEVCSNGLCTPQTCGTGLTLCSATCVNLKGDLANCGSCGNSCKTGETCFQGKCQTSTCKGGLYPCSGSCVDLESDIKNCGACANACQSTEQCVRGLCTACTGGLTECSGGCVNLQNDVNNCGTCGTRCAEGERCFSGICSYGRCQMDASCPGDLVCIQERCTRPLSVGVFPLDGLKSLDSLEKSLLPKSSTTLYLNCPVVDADAKLLKGLSKPDAPYPKVQLWFRKLKAFCYLVQGGKELLGAGEPGLPGPEILDLPLDAYFIRQDLTFGTDQVISVLAKRNQTLTDRLPGQSGYSPLVKEIDLIVGKDHEFRDLRSTAEVKAALAKGSVTQKPTQKLHNLVVRGTIPACTTDADCAGTGGKVDAPLKCSPESGYCSPPFARLGEECRREVKECDPKGGAGGSRLACVGLRVRQKYYCFNACDSSKTDENPDKDIDSRCGSAPSTRCYGLRQTDPSRPNGVCIRICNSRAGNREALLKECELSGCADGKLEYGETCDDGNRLNKDGCNKYCTLSTYDRCEQNSDCKGTGQTCKEPVFGQKNNYCLPSTSAEKDEDVEGGKYRITCMEYDYCWPPDERADWLGTKEDAQ